jgi:hypothetical protein
MGDMKNAYNIFDRKHEETIGRTRHIWEDNIRMDLTGIRWQGVDWIYVDQDEDQ